LGVFLRPVESFVDDETKLTLHGIQQYWLELTEPQKNRELNNLWETFDCNRM
jgi:ATP-dependent RNA helicase UAP56/SUB2